MSEYIYNVSLKTQLGMKNGIMHLYIENGKVGGYLDILKHSEPLIGNISLTGDCTLHGKIKTLVRFIQYTATGYIDQNIVRLVLNSNKEQFEMTGTAEGQKVL